MKGADRLRDPRFEAAVEGLLDSYVSVGGINHIEGHNLPSLGQVVEVLHLLEAVLFPGYYEAARLGARNARYVIGEHCARLYECLAAEVAKSLEHTARCETAGDFVSGREANEQAERIVFELLETLPSIRATLYEDAQAALEGDPAARSIVEVLLAYPSIRAIGIHRVANFLHRRKVPLIPRMMSEHVHGQTGIDIHPGATIGPGLFIDHGTGVVIGETAVLGRWCKLYQGVTLGALSVSKHEETTWDPPKRHPTLEDRVTVYAGATILGGRTLIGEGSIVGGNVWLTRSIPPGTKVQIEPPFLLYRGASAISPVREPMDYQI
ncbi:serine O-acetyltransferase [Vulgatibacter incomptus]|uniref:Serine acetyltransferase n=1 Tax=Vulgatibacter incomptus TaxID=1391653 RepID=A0A0K1PHF0_9BACT|nr:serine O-acetyltransferase [Vulgatibacter incomptus]AKU92937.1 Serine acetyltransferase [Vulgatibacter incomptus]